MAYKYVDAPVFFKHRGVKIYAVFKNDNIALKRRENVFGLSPDCSEKERVGVFDIRTVARLLGYYAVAESLIIPILREAIEAGLLTQRGIDRERFWHLRSKQESWQLAKEAVLNMGDIFYAPEDINEDFGLDENGEPEYPGETPEERVKYFATACVQKAIEKALERQAKAIERGEIDGTVA